VYKPGRQDLARGLTTHLFLPPHLNHHRAHQRRVRFASQQGATSWWAARVTPLALGMSVSDISGKAIANLATEDLSHPAPCPRRPLYCETEVLESKESQERIPTAGPSGSHPRVNPDGRAGGRVKRLVARAAQEPGDPVESA